MSNSSSVRVFVALIFVLLLSAGSIFSANLSPEERTDKAVSSVWWHDSDLVFKGKITPQQQATMDAEVLSLFTKLEGLRQSGIKDRQRFIKALESGDLKTAHTTAEAIAQRNTERDLALRVLKIQVLSTLAPEQRTALTENNPTLIRRQWFSLGGSSRQRVKKSGGGARRTHP